MHFSVRTLIYACTKVACPVINVHFYFLFFIVLFLCFFQVSWCAQVFNEPGSVLCMLITQTLTHLDPSLSSCINEFIKNQSNIIEKLIELRRVRTCNIQLLAGTYTYEIINFVVMSCLDLLLHKPSISSVGIPNHFMRCTNVLPNFPFCLHFHETSLLSPFHSVLHGNSKLQEVIVLKIAWLEEGAKGCEVSKMWNLTFKYSLQYAGLSLQFRVAVWLQ